MYDDIEFTLEPLSLDRFELVGRLGEGADLQVFAATDRESGEAVVVKRPHPSLVTRNIHDDVERRLLLQGRLRAGLGAIPSVPRLYGVAGPDVFETYFGDDLGRAYHVLVEERARGIPLVGSVGDQVRGHPVGLPINLFVFHAPGNIRRNPASDVLEVIARCLDQGYLALDLGPRNVFYSPGSGASTVIDLGDIAPPQAGTRRREQVDLNDMLLEFFALYTTPQAIPPDPGDFALLREPRAAGTISRRARSVAEDYSTIVDDRRRTIALYVLDRIGERGYDSLGPFEHDFEEYLAGARAELEESPGFAARWMEAADRLREPYWSKYLFNPDAELASYPYP